MALFGKPKQPMANMTDAERLAQIMQGNLSGQLSSGDKLSALGALLKSVSRGSTTSPQQVIQNLQQQKMQEVQGRLQIDQLRQQAAKKAQLDALRAEYARNVKDPQLARGLQIVSDDAFEKFILEQGKPQGMGQWSESLQRFIPKDQAVPTRSGRINGKRVDQYSDGSTRVYEADGSFKTYDVQGNLING